MIISLTIPFSLPSVQDSTIQFYLKQGASRDQLVLGIPTYGRSYTLVNPDAHETGSPTDGPGTQGQDIHELMLLV